MTSALTRRVLAGTAVVTLGLGMVACNQDTSKEVGDAAASATAAAGEAADAAKDKAGEVADSAKDKASDAAEDAADKASKAADAAKDKASEAKDAAEGATTSVTLADGQTEDVDADLAAAISNAEDEKGLPAEIVSEGGATIAKYSHDYWLVSNDEGSVVPIIGNILYAWQENGAVESDLGLPTAPEKPVAGGYHQSFDNGDITWIGATGESTVTLR